jgi:uncharacterized membrane protein YgcG
LATAAKEDEMKRLLLFASLTLLIGLPLRASDGKAQSYFTYDDGGTMVRQDERGDNEARVNYPVFPGDEVTTGRRGRSEIRLSDGNVLGLDRTTTIHFQSILGSYDGDSSQTIAELRFGHVIVQRTESGSDTLRLDSASASYLATAEAIYAVDSDGRGHDRVTVYEGTVEVRTPQNTTTLHGGDEAHVDEQGLYGVAQLASNSTDDFERWFLRRSERYSRASSRYLDRSLAYSDYDLDTNGSWIYASSYGSWCWRPNVGADWRPYFNGVWYHSPGGFLTWVSYEPWGWVPYHYGRWAFDPGYGWVWIPGTGYAPAWVYWMYGPSYIGWIPAGYYDCYRPYYSWAYHPYVRTTIGFGFYGRVRIDEIDLRPWTFVDANTIVSTRVDRAALTADIVRERLARDRGGIATVSNGPARFTRPELRDPAAALTNIERRGLGTGAGKEGPGSPADMTPFFRRDPELATGVRDRIARTLPGDSSHNGPGSVSAPSDGRINRGNGAADIGGLHRGVDTPPTPAVDRGTSRINRGADPPQADRPLTRDPQAGPTQTPGWRDRLDRGTTRPAVETPPATIDRGTPPATIDRSSTPPPAHDSSTWRNRAVSRDPASTPPPAAPGSSKDSPSDVPHRVIDRIGGARVYPGDSTDRGRSSGTTGSGSRGSSSPPPQKSSPAPSSGSGSSGSHGSSNSGGSNSGSSHSGGNSGGSSGGSHSDGGHSSSSSSSSSGHSDSGHSDKHR